MKYFCYLILLVTLLMRMETTTYAQAADTTQAYRSFQRAKQLFQAGQYQQIMLHLDTAIVGLDPGNWTTPDSQLISRWLSARNYRNQVLGQMGQVEPAFQEIDSLLADARRLMGSNHANTVFSLAQKATLYFTVGNLSQAKDTIISALELAKQNPDISPTSLAVIRNVLVTIYWKLGEYEPLFEALEASIEVFEHAPDAPSNNLAFTYLNLGVAKAERGDIWGAKQAYLRCISILRDLYPAAHPIFILPYQNLANVWYQLGDMGRAQTHFDKALEICLPINGERHEMTSKIREGLANMAYSCGDYGQAVGHLKKSIATKKALYGEINPLLIISYGQMSLNFFAQEKLDSALFFVEKATFIHQQTYQGVNSDYMRLIEQKGEILEALKRESDAIRLWQSFLESVDSTNDFFAIRIQLRLAVLLAQTGDCKQAKHWRQSVAQNWESHTELKQNYLQRQFIFHHIALATQVCDSLGQHAMVVDSLLDQSLAAFDHLLKADVSSDSREWILDLRLPLFESSVSNLWTLAQDKPEDGYDEDLLRIMEKNKSSLLHIALQQADSRLSDKRSVQLAEQEMKIKRDLRYYERKIFEQNAIPPSANNREKWYAKKFEAQQQLDSLLVRIQQEDARYYELRYAEKSLQLPEIKDLLGPNQCLISYFWGDKQLYAARITQADGLRIYQLEKGTAQLIDSFLQSIWAYPLNQMESGQSEKSYNARYRQLALTCYEKWLLPLDISSYPELIIIPDGPLSYLPFEVLLSQSPPEEALYRDYPYLLKSHSIAYAFSINHWLRQQGKSFIGQNGLLAIAPQFSATPTQANRGEGQLKALYFNKQEAQEIADQWDGDVLVDEAASLDNFLKNAPDYPILHLSTHAMLNDRDSRYTYIAFAPQSDSVADKLFFSDLLAMQLKAEMVVLSACETAQGSWQHGEGINSLARGFAYAGAKSLVPTLWAVDDQSTAALMTYFYQELKRGKNKAEALQLAKLKILQERDLPPFYWAAPILIGNTQAITSHAAYKYLIFIGISILLALIVAWFWRKNKKR